jgi:hypothetical protein
VRRSRKARFVFVALLVAVPTACAGDGTGLDPNPPLEATFSSIQGRIFTPICTQCHAGANAPLAFSLEASVSYGNLVNVPSVEVDDLMRVRPGQPDSSYLVLKVEGAPGIVGERMPRLLPKLAAEEIQAIRDWIAAGALQN